MLSWLFLISGTALFFYAAIPLLFARITQRKAENMLQRLQETSYLAITVTGVSGRVLSVSPVKTSEAGQMDTLDPKKTHFYGLAHSGTVFRIKWQDISAVKLGGTAMVYRPDANERKTVCVFHEERDTPTYDSVIANAILTAENAVKPYSVAVGVLIEFIFFLHALHQDRLSAIAIFSLIAIFGKALPYCPPGLLLTFLGQKLTASTVKRDKKSRQRGTAGILLYSAGILLNIAVLLIIISSTGLDGNII